MRNSSPQCVDETAGPAFGNDECAHLLVNRLPRPAGLLFDHRHFVVVDHQPPGTGNAIAQVFAAEPGRLLAGVIGKKGFQGLGIRLHN